LQKKWLNISLLGFVLIWFVQSKVKILINVSDSLPGVAYLLIKGLEPRKSDTVSFYAKGNEFYSEDLIFTKLIGGVSGDTITEVDREYFINEEAIGVAKEYSRNGTTLQKGPVGVLGEKQFFVYSSAKDGFDSRYQNIAWIDRKDIIGRAYRIL